MNTKTIIIIALVLLLISGITYKHMKSTGGINNVGNIRNSPIKFQGEITKPEETFKSFDTLENGIRAMYSLLNTYRKKYGLNTIAGILNRWAPTSENNTNGYIQRVVKETGIKADAILKVTDLPKIVVAMGNVEMRKPITLSDALNSYNKNLSLFA